VRYFDEVDGGGRYHYLAKQDLRRLAFLLAPSLMCK